MERLPDWEVRLTAYLDAPAPELCALFADGAVRAVTGESIAARHRGKFARVRSKLRETIDAALPAQSAAFARRGDLAWHEGAVGVIVGGEALFVGENGFVRVSRDQWEKVWAVGNG